MDEALASGVEVRQFLSGLRRRLRDLLMIAVGAAPELDVSSPEMLRVVHNLLDNAIRHTPS